MGQVKRSLARRGLTRLPFAHDSIDYVKRKWFSEFDEHSKKGVWVAVDGLKLRMPPRFTARYVMEEYEPLMRKTFLQSLRRGDVVVDVGAHIGYYSLLAARVVGNTGRVHAVEPCKETALLLQESIKANDLTNLTVHCCAAGSSHHVRQFQLTGSSDSHGFYRHPNTETIATVEVQQEPLDRLIQGRADLIKIDVEGAEIEVLKGMNDLLAFNRNVTVWTEWFPAGMISAGRDPLELPERLKCLGFTDITVIDEHTKTISRIEDSETAMRAGSMPKSWYANIRARRNSFYNNP